GLPDRLCPAVHGRGPDHLVDDPVPAGRLARHAGRLQGLKAGFLGEFSPAGTSAATPAPACAALAGDTGRFQGPNGGKKGLLRRLPIPTIRNSQAGIAQLVERNLAKVEVASSNLVSRSSFQKNLVFDEVFSYPRSGSPIFQVFRPGGGAGVECQPAVRGSVAEWSCRGLQIPVRRFNSGPSLHYFPAFYFRRPPSVPWSGPGSLATIRRIAAPARMAKL